MSNLDGYKLLPTMDTPTGTEGEVCKDIAKRQALGLAKYGTTVAANPLELKQWLQHQYEELLDAAIYAKRAIEELDKPKFVPVGTIEQQVFQKFPLCSTFDYLGVKMVVIEHRRSRPGIPYLYMGFGITLPETPEVHSALICNYNEGGRLQTKTFSVGSYPHLLSSCKPQ